MCCGKIGSCVLVSSVCVVVRLVAVCKGAFALALQSGLKPLQSRSHCTQFSRKWIKSGSVRSTYGRWIDVDPSRFNERRGRCRVELRVSSHF